MKSLTHDHGELMVAYATGTRRAVPFGAPTFTIAYGGCLEPDVVERPTGEIDIEFESQANQEYLISVELMAGDGITEGEFISGDPPARKGAPSYFSAGLSNDSYTITIETETEPERLEWSVTEGRGLDLDVTVLANGVLDIERSCQSP